MHEQLFSKKANVSAKCLSVSTKTSIPSLSTTTSDTTKAKKMVKIDFLLCITLPSIMAESVLINRPIMISNLKEEWKISGTFVCYLNSAKKFKAPLKPGSSQFWDCKSEANSKKSQRRKSKRKTIGRRTIKKTKRKKTRIRSSPSRNSRVTLFIAHAFKTKTSSRTTTLHDGSNFPKRNGTRFSIISMANSRIKSISSLLRRPGIIPFVYADAVKLRVRSSEPWSACAKRLRIEGFKTVAPERQWQQ